jgi:hypothetical protein
LWLSSSFRYVTAGFEALTVVLTLPTHTRAAGLVLGGAILLAAIATLVRAGEYGHTVPALIGLVAIILMLR